MKISVNWMQQVAGGDVKILPKGGIDELVAKIGAQLGAVEEVVDLGKRYQHIVIAQVVSCEKHPNADKLSVCLIDDGGKTKGVKRDKNGYVQVVCGAPNVRKGLTVAWLPPGSTVPSSYDKEPFVLERRELRGVVSNGMIASAAELAISDNHDGILEIDNTRTATKKDPEVDINDHLAAMQNIELVQKHKPGDDFATAFGLNDYVIDIENKMFTHRPDCFGQLGVAREIAGITGQTFTSPNVYLSSRSQIPNSKDGLQIKIQNNVPKLVPRFMAQVFENVTVGPSPVWMQTYLSRVGVRPINNIVDITNYFMLLTGQPMHAYDADKLSIKSIETRMSKKGDKLKLLNGKEITLEDDSTILITSNNVPVGIGGVMGGADTEVDKNTKNIVLECANFDMYSIRRTAMKYGLFTEAVTRFNKGQSPLQCDRILAWATSEIICDAGGEPGNIYDVQDDMKKPATVRVSVKFVNDRLGLALTRSDMEKLLTNVEFETEIPDNKDEFKVTSPFWRTDIEIAEDIVEEVGRLYGFDHLPLDLPKRNLTPTKPDELLELKQQIRETLAKAGANEVLTYSFVHGNLLEKVGQDTKQAFKLSNALSPDLQYYRISLMPSLLDKVHMNIKAGYDQFALFEINKTHIKGQNDSADPKVPKEFENLALVVANSDKIKGLGAAYFQARQYLDYLAESFGIDVRYEPLSEPPTYPAAAPYDYKRSARIYVGDKLIGLIGEFKPSVLRVLKLPAASAGFEIGINPVNFRRTVSQYKPLSKYPSVQQDISLKVPATTNYHAVYELLAAELLDQPNMLADLNPLDIYQSEKDKKHKQMAFRLTIASYQKTLKSEEVNSMLDNAAKVAAKKLGAERL